MKIKYLNIDRKNRISTYFFNSSPTLLLIAGVHGDEKTGIVILRDIIKYLKNDRGSYPVAIIPCLNKGAYLANSRVDPKDKVDLNRVFPVGDKRSHTFKIARAIQNFAENFSIVVDIHVFTDQHTLMCGVDLNILKGEKKKIIQEIMSKIGLHSICKIDHSSEPGKDGSLCSYLQYKNILSFGIELSPLEICPEMDFNKIKTGLVSLIKGFPLSIRSKKLKSYIRLKCFSKNSGIFSPVKFPGVTIKEGEIVGTLFKDGRILPVKSPFKGDIISISYEKFVKEGDRIFVVGKKIS